MNRAGWGGAAVLGVLLAGAILRGGSTMPARAEDPVPAKPAETVVAADGSGNCLTIAEAIAVAPPGATGKVKPGTYVESLLFDRDVTLVATEVKGKVVLEGAAGKAILDSFANVTVEGFTLRGAKGFDGFALVVRGGRAVFRGCEVTAPDGQGLWVGGGAAVLDAVVVKDCLYDGISVRKQGRLQVIGGAVRHCGREGILVEDESEGTVSKCEIAEHGSTGLRVRAKAKVRIASCRFQDSKGNGILVDTGGSAEGEDLDFTRNGLSAVEVRTGGRVVCKGCRWKGGKQDGVQAAEGGHAFLEKCLLDANGAAGLRVTGEGSTGEAKDTRFLYGKENGVAVLDSGVATLDKCEIYSAGLSGVVIWTKGEGILRDTRITKCGDYAVTAQKEAGGKVLPPGVEPHADGASLRGAGREQPVGEVHGAHRGPPAFATVIGSPPGSSTGSSGRRA